MPEYNKEEDLMKLMQDAYNKSLKEIESSRNMTFHPNDMSEKSKLKNKLDIPALIQMCHQASVDGGWWHDLETKEPLQRDMFEILMLMVSEVAEAMEGERKNLKDDKLPHRPMAEVELADTIIRICDFLGSPIAIKFPDVYTQAYWDEIYKKNLEEEIKDLSLMETKGGKLYVIAKEICDNVFIDAIIHIIAYAEIYNYDLVGAINEKIEYNKNRADHKPENRIKEGGKKF